MNGPVLNKLSPDTQREECHKQHSSTAKHDIFFSSLSQSFLPPLLPLDIRQALPQTEISPVISKEAHSRWGKKRNGYNKMKGRKDAGIYVFWKAIYLYSSILFHLSFFVCAAPQWRQGPPLDSIWRCCRGVFLFFLRQDPQIDQWK